MTIGNDVVGCKIILTKESLIKFFLKPFKYQTFRIPSDLKEKRYI
jgi:hypothetical protein